MTRGHAWCEAVPHAHATTIQVEITSEATPALDAADIARADVVWTRLQERNPRLFDGSILCFTSADLTRSAVTASRSSYKWHAVGDEVSTGLRLLAVTGVLMMRGSDGRDRVHLGRRSAQSHHDPGLWEFGPSGGLSPPPSSRLTFTDILADLHREIVEECGVAMDLREAAAVALCHDSAARSVDIVVLARAMTTTADVPSPIDGEEHWEYEAAAWVAVDDLAAFASRHACIATTHAIAEHLGWLPHHA